MLVDEAQANFVPDEDEFGYDEFNFSHAEDAVSPVVSGSILSDKFNPARYKNGQTLSSIREALIRVGATKDVISELVHEAQLAKIDEFLGAIIEELGELEAINQLKKFFSFSPNSSLGEDSESVEEACCQLNESRNLSFKFHADWLGLLEAADVKCAVSIFCVRAGVLKNFELSEKDYMKMPEPSKKTEDWVSSLFQQELGIDIDPGDDDGGVQSEPEFDEDSYARDLLEGIQTRNEEAIKYYIHQLMQRRKQQGHGK